ncbi:Short-chain dehydrogenase/reductase SDR [Enterobacter sp. FY-07]|uniref:SDR family NAD(P)-dependent oxidoreductase n=1 Tax=Kosakonia oryzendophytica TaxID=1005665 RepID=UPI000777143D|nr:SDR family oxidoreductase [Kosakonia oryzendophytica]AMO49526.1 Short-chain dehydrogenase/reductase SDR [Enterobacter sp. FY-07]TDT59596.1 NAD(P)-dependent dehydrogenase (short-subunit alcohol dehydrogenase family) [Enterobacter sp. AG5470]WBT56024.1 SDR family oxidoreductase [Kosakonia oryzendophytica]
MGRLDNKVAVVLGGAKGIGLAISQRFTREGATTWFTSRRDEELQAASRTLSGVSMPLRADVSQQSELARIMATVKAQAGRIDVLVINAGMSEYATLGEISEAHFDQIFGLNVRSPVFALQAALPLLQPGASVVLIGSIADTIGTEGYGVYGASKAALRSFARTWTRELSSRGIRINVVAPGPIDTEMMAAVTDEVRDALTRNIPLHRMGKPDEVANAALFLASDESSYIAGAEICVDGGMTQV